MKFKLLGKSGLRVSEIALGTMTIGNAWGWGAEKEDSLRALKTYADLGGNFIDTSANYQDGLSEQLIGEFTKGNRDEFILATKYSLREGNIKGNPNYGGNHRKNLIRSIEKSIERLQTDYIDILYLHMWDFTVDIEHVMRILDDLVASSKVNYIGISDTPAWIISRAQTIAEMRGWHIFQVSQFPYSLRSRSAEREVMPMCKDLDIAMTTWSTLGAGLFTGKYTRQEDTTGRLTEGKWGAPGEKSLEMAREVDKIADEIGCSSSNVATRWVMDKPGVVIPILGANNSDQVIENLKTVNISLSKDQTLRLDKLAEFIRGYAYDFLEDDEIKNLLHGDTFDNIVNHRS